VPWSISASTGNLLCAAVRVLRDSCDPDSVNQALLLLPDWVQWCARRTELAPEFADCALSAVRVEAASPAGARQVTHTREERFRRPE
jgi:hypothetical protein